jgi:hypothetical protein
VPRDDLVAHLPRAAANGAARATAWRAGLALRLRGLRGVRVTFTLLGKRWRLERVESLPGLDGECEWAARTVRVVDGLHPKAHMETVLHEILHAQDESMPEKRVAAVARSMASVLWRLGWRRAP